MATSEFRYNIKRKHYSYIYKRKGDYRYNLLLSSKSIRKLKKRTRTKIINNVKLYKNPNPNKMEIQYIMTKKYLDHKDSFGPLINGWLFDRNDKRLIKRLKRGTAHKKSQSRTPVKCISN